MAIFRVEKTRDYTVMSNYHIRDRQLSFKAKGILSMMLSLPDDWDYTLTGLKKLSTDGIDSVRRGLLELEQHGYLVRKRVRNSNGTYGGIEYFVYERPIAPPSQETPVQDEPMLEKPILENPMQVKPTQDYCTQLSTKKQNTNQSNTKESNTHSINPYSRIDERNERSGFDRCRDLILENISYDHLVSRRGIDPSELDNLVDIMTEVLASNRKFIRVGGEDKPAAVVQSQLLKLNAEHIEFVLDCMHSNTTEIRNIRSYLLTSLYRAPMTMDSYYAAKVNHDLAHEPVVSTYIPPGHPGIQSADPPAYFR